MLSTRAGCWWLVMLQSLPTRLGAGARHPDNDPPESTRPVSTPDGLGLSPKTCPSRARQGQAGASPSGQQRGWARGDACQTLGAGAGAGAAERFCSFTDPSFDDGLGLSLVTTAGRLEELFSSSSPGATVRPGATKEEEEEEEEKKKPRAQAAPSFHDEEIPGKGIGLVASRRIAAGELILARTPAVLVDERGFEGLGEEALRRLLVQAIGGLPQRHRAQYLNLSTHDDVESHDEKVYQVFAKNNYRTRITDTTDFHATFVDVSRLNHGCRPNCGYHFDTATLSQKIFAARDILPGEELTVSYIDLVQTRDTRQTQLHSSWGFKCTCSLCAAEEDETARSDQRVRQIHSLWKELDDYGPASAATPEKAEELLGLYEVEGLETRIHEAYYRAAIEWNGVGDSNNAVKYAMLSILRGQVMKGPERPFLSSMRELIKNPEDHWTWKFRHRQEAPKDEL